MLPNLFAVFHASLAVNTRLCVRAIDETPRGPVDYTSSVTVGMPIKVPGRNNVWRVPYDVTDAAGNRAQTVYREVIIEVVSPNRARTTGSAAPAAAPQHVPSAPIIAQPAREPTMPRPYTPPPPTPVAPSQPQARPVAPPETKRPSIAPIPSTVKWQEVRPSGEHHEVKPTPPAPTPTPAQPSTRQYQRAPSPFVHPSPTRWQQIPEPQQEFSFFSQLLLPLLLGTSFVGALSSLPQLLTHLIWLCFMQDCSLST
jgi:hypothetical protein